MKDRRKRWSIKSGEHFNANLFSGRNLRPEAWGPNSFGSSTVRSNSNRLKCRNRSKVVTFIFRYRSIGQLSQKYPPRLWFFLDQLIANDIAPRPRPEKRAAEVEVVEISDNSEDEVDLKVARLKVVSICTFCVWTEGCPNRQSLQPLKKNGPERRLRKNMWLKKRMWSL